MVSRALPAAKLYNPLISKVWRAPTPLEGGFARDGGLCVPETWPQLSLDTIAGFFGRPYWEVAVDVIRPFVGGEIPDAELGRMANEAYATFRHPAVVPLSQVSPNQFVR